MPSPSGVGSMHLLIATLGSAGDVHPFLAIGGTAQARGHRVTVCTNPAFQAAVECDAQHVDAHWNGALALLQTCASE